MTYFWEFFSKKEYSRSDSEKDIFLIISYGMFMFEKLTHIISRLVSYLIEAYFTDSLYQVMENLQIMSEKFKFRNLILFYSILDIYWSRYYKITLKFILILENIWKLDLEQLSIISICKTYPAHF